MRTPPDGYRKCPVDLSALAEKKIGIIGYGNQAHAWALNMFDSGLEVYIGLRVRSPHSGDAIADLIEVLTPDRAAKMCDIICMLIPDEVIPICLRENIFPNIAEGDAIVFAHSYSLFAGDTKLPRNIDCILLAPHGPGTAVREAYLAESGIPAQMAIVQDFTGNADAIALGLASSLGFASGGLRPTDYRQETIIDLFSEQAVLVGGLVAIIKQALEALESAGYDTASSRVSCLDEIIGTAILFAEGGLAGGLEKVSTAAAFGALKAEELLRPPLKEVFKILLADIESGKFAAELESASSAESKDLEEFKKQLRKIAGR